LHYPLPVDFGKAGWRDGIKVLKAALFHSDFPAVAHAGSAIYLAGRGGRSGGNGASGMPPGGDDGNDADGNGGAGSGVSTKTRPKTKKPSLYKVLILNDDYTPMEFVVHVLERFFGKRQEEAIEIMLHVHRKGVGICGVYTFEVAETKVTQVIELARRHQHPLQCTMEKE
jgi:ATP-dependent Clp protease adaptor protein ClpS